MNSILTKLFDFFKSRNPKVFAIFVAILGAIYYLGTNDVISIPKWLIDIVVSLGLVSSTSTPKIRDNG